VKLMLGRIQIEMLKSAVLALELMSGCSGECVLVNDPVVDHAVVHCPLLESIMLNSLRVSDAPLDCLVLNATKVLNAAHVLSATKVLGTTDVTATESTSHVAATHVATSRVTTSASPVSMIGFEIRERGERRNQGKSKCNSCDANHGRNSCKRGYANLE
jgi:hypothetical protein